MGAAQAIAQVREREAHIRELEATVQDLELQASDARKAAMVAEAEKSNLAKQGLLVRAEAAQNKEAKALAEGQAVVDVAYVEGQYAKARAANQRAQAELAEMKTKFETLELEHKALQLRRQAEEDQASALLRQAEASRLYTIITLMENYNKAIQSLYDELYKVAEKAIDFPRHIVNLCEKMNFKQIKVDAAAELVLKEEGHEDQTNRDRRSLGAKAMEFLFQDSAIAAPLQSYLSGTEEAQQRILSNVAPPEAGAKAEERRGGLEAVAEGGVTVSQGGSGAMDVVMTLNRKFDNLRTQGDKDDFERMFVQELVSTLGIPADRIAIDGLAPGSIVVKFSILPPAPLDDPLPDRPGSSASRRPGTSLSRGVSGLTAAARKASALACSDLPASSVVQLSSHITTVRTRCLGLTLCGCRIDSALQDPASKLRRAQLGSSATTIKFITAPYIRSREAKRQLKALAPRIEEASQALAELKEQHKVLSMTLQEAADAAAMLQRVRRGMIGRRDGKQRRQWRDASRRIQKVVRGHHGRVRFRALKEAAAIQDEEERRRRLEELSLVEQQRIKALQELAEARQRYNTRKNERQGYRLETPVVQAPPVVVEDPFAGSDAWMENYLNERFTDFDEVLASDILGDGAAPWAEIKRHARPFFYTTYHDFREERQNLARHAFPNLHQLCSERGVAFNPAEVYLQLDQDLHGRAAKPWQWTGLDLNDYEVPPVDEAAHSRDILFSLLAEVTNTNAWVFFFGQVYGVVPGGAWATVAKRKFRWFREFYDETAFDTASLADIAFHKIVASRLDEISTALKGKVMFLIREETFADAFPPDIAACFSETEEGRIELNDRVKDGVRSLPLPCLDNYRAPAVAAREADAELQRFVTSHFLLLGDGYENRRHRLSHSAFGLARREPFVLNRHHFNRLHAHLDPRASILSPVVLHGPPGIGKTALVSKYLELHRGALPSALWFTYFVGSSPGSTDYQRVCTVLREALKDRFKIDLDIDRSISANMMARDLSQWLAAAATKGLVILLLDGLDQIDDLYDGGEVLEWLPVRFPARVRVVITSAPGPVLEAARRRDWPVLDLEPLSESERLEVGNRHTSLRDSWADPLLKVLSSAHIAKIADCPPATNPLHFRYLVDELHQQNQRNALNAAELYGGNACEWQLLFRATDLPSLLDYVLHRWESQYDTERCPLLVRRVTCLLWASRWGLSEYELLTLLPDMPRLYLIRFLEATHFSWVQHSGYFLFAHRAMRDAVQKRYMPTERERGDVHTRLGGYFRSLPQSRRRLEEELFQWQQAQRWVNVLGIVSDMALFPLLFDESVGSLHCDLRRAVREADNSLNVYQGLLDGLTKYELGDASKASAGGVGVLVAKFFGEMGRSKQASQMYEAILAQPASVLNANVETRHRVASLRLNYGELLMQRWLEKADAESTSFALVNAAQDQYEEAIKSLRVLVAIDEEEVGRLSHQGLDGTTEEEAKEVKAALEAASKLYQEAVSLLANGLCKIGRLGYKAGDFDGSQNSFQEAKLFIETRLSPTHPLVGDCCQGLGELLLQRGNYAEAERNARKSMSIRQLSVGSNHPLFAETVETLSKIVEATGHHFESEQLAARAAKIRAFYEQMQATLQRKGPRVLQPHHEHSSAHGSNIANSF